MKHNYKATLLTILTLASTPASAANLLFKSNFGSGVVLNPPTGFSAATSGAGNAWQSITGVDSETGYDWSKKPLGAYFFGLQIITAEPVNSSTIGSHVYNAIRTVPGPDGKPINELFHNLKYKPWVGATPEGKGAAQVPFLLNRPWTVGDVKDLYITYWFKHQPDLVESLDPKISSGNWRVQFEFKTGGYNNTYGGDYRIQTTILKGSDNKLYWMSKGDNVANGPWPRVDYWIERNMTVPVPVDKWFKYEVYWHRSTGADGRYWTAVDGQVITDHFGPNMGDLNLPINRIFISNSYSGGKPEIQSQIAGLEIWDDFPCGKGLSCFNKKIDSTPPSINITSPTDGSKVSGIVPINSVVSSGLLGSGVKQTLYINGALKTTVNGSSLSYAWDVSKERLLRTNTGTSNKCTIMILARDAAGKTALKTITVYR